MKYLYTILPSRIIVCDFARLTPKPEDQYDHWKRTHTPNNLHPVSLDEEKEEKEAEQKQEQPKLKQIDKPLYI